MIPDEIHKKGLLAEHLLLIGQNVTSLIQSLAKEGTTVISI